MKGWKDYKVQWCLGTQTLVEGRFPNNSHFRRTIASIVFLSRSL